MKKIIFITMIVLFSIVLLSNIVFANNITINNKSINASINNTDNFSIGNWLFKVPWGEILINTLSAPLKAFVWLNEGLSHLVLFVIRIFSPTVTFSPFYGLIILIPIVMYLLWKVSNILISAGTSWTALIFIVLAAVFIIGLVLTYMGVI